MTFDAVDRSHWHQKLVTLHDYWAARQPSVGLLPGRQHIDPLDLRTLLPNLWLVDVVADAPGTGGELRFRYRLAGTKVVEARGGHDPTGQFVDQVNPMRRPNVSTAERLTAIVLDRRPSWRRGTPNNQRIPDIKTIENLFLPLAADGSTVNMILCCSLYFDLAGKEL